MVSEPGFEPHCLPLYAYYIPYFCPNRHFKAFSWTLTSNRRFRFVSSTMIRTFRAWFNKLCYCCKLEINQMYWLWNNVLRNSLNQDTDTKDSCYSCYLLLIGHLKTNNKRRVEKFTKLKIEQINGILRHFLESILGRESLWHKKRIFWTFKILFCLFFDWFLPKEMIWHEFLKVDARYSMQSHFNQSAPWLTPTAPTRGQFHWQFLVTIWKCDQCQFH